MDVVAFLGIKTVMTPTAVSKTRDKGGDIQKQKILHPFLSLGTQNGNLDRSTIGNNLVRVDTLTKLLFVEEILHMLLNLGNSSRTTNKHIISDIALVHLGMGNGRVKVDKKVLLALSQEVLNLFNALGFPEASFLKS